MNVRVRALTIEYRALPIHPIDPSPTPTPTATRTRITVTVGITVYVRIDDAVTYGDSVAWWALVFIYAIGKTVHQPS
jgi:hypothetical protein